MPRMGREGHQRRRVVRHLGTGVERIRAGGDPPESFHQTEFPASRDGVHRAITRPAELRPGSSRAPALGNFSRTLYRCRSEGQSGPRCLPCRNGHRVRLRVDHYRPGFQPIQRPALAASASLTPPGQARRARTYAKHGKHLAAAGRSSSTHPSHNVKPSRGLNSGN